MPKAIRVYVLRDVRDGLFDEGRVVNDHPVCTAQYLDQACEYDETDLAETYPAGLPVGWEKIKVLDYQPRNRRPHD